MEELWSPSNWRNLSIKQQPIYEDIDQLRAVELKLQKMLPIVSTREVDLLLYSLSKVLLGRSIVLHGGDCAETFININSDSILQYTQLMNSIEVLLHKKTNKEIIVIGRVAGQFAKPRSADFELSDGDKLPVYRGDMVNSIEYDEQHRKPNAQRLIDGYYHSVKAMKLIQKFNESKQNYISHEALLLNYEQCFTRKYRGKYYNLSAHFLWVGNRTRAIKEAHIEYVRGINNPVGIKIDSSVTQSEVLDLIKCVNPHNIPGKLVLIFRMGAVQVKSCLSALVQAIKKNDLQVIYMCDPMHGNTIISQGCKIRSVNTILLELEYFLDILKEEKVSFGGVHLEMTNQDIMECVDHSDTVRHYNSYCDPRLNFKQSIRVVDYIANKL